MTSPRPQLKISLILVLLVACFTLKAQRNDILTLTDQDSVYYTIGKHMAYLKDASDQLSYEDVIQQDSEFKPIDQQVPSFGIKDETVWLKLSIQNTFSEWPEYILQIAFPTLDSVFFYQHVNGQLKQGFQGDRIKFSNRPYNHKYFNFDVHQPADSTDETTIYLKIRNGGSKLLPIHLIPADKLYAEDFKEELLYGVFYGIMIVMMLYNLFLAFSARNKSYLYYIGIILGNILTLSAVNGHAFQYLWYDYPWWANHVIIFGIGLWIFSGNKFANHFLEARKNNRSIYKFLKVMQLLGLGFMLAAFLLPYYTIIELTNYGLILNCITLLFAGAYFWYKKVPVASVFTLSWLAYLSGVFLYTLRNLAIVPVNFLTSHMLEIGAISEVILLAIALGHKYRLLENDKNRAQEHALDLMTQSSDLIREQNEKLEEIVEERTKELQQKQEEIITQNEELNTKNEKLVEAQSIIEKQNIRLKNYNENLEFEVEKRTEDLKKTNRALAENVQKLEQYAFMTAHNLRAPVARILGLTHLIEIGEYKQLNQDTLSVLTKIKEEGDSLDAVIKDLNAVIELRNEKEPFIEEVPLKKVHQQTLRILRNTIDLNEAIIELELNEYSTIKANPTFIESIWYNLLSNAIKYRSSDKPHIIISVYEKEHKRIIAFQDNGIGIDLEKHGNTIFDMYSRYHEDISGKGLGLFLVKSQMEMMGGEVLVTSKLGEGSCFLLHFNK